MDGRTVASATPDGAEVLDAAVVGFIASHNLSHLKGQDGKLEPKLNQKKGHKGPKKA